MDDDTQPTLPDMMHELRKLTRQLEKAFADNIRSFEDTTGLTVDGIELIHTVNTEMGKEPSIMRIASVKLDVRL